MNSRKAFVLACILCILLILIVIITIVVVASTSKKSIDNVELKASTEVTIPNDYPERLIQGVKDGDLETVEDLLAMTKDYVDMKPEENE